MLNLKDNFEGKINTDIWDLKRIEKNCWSLKKFKGKNSLKITVHKYNKQQISNDGQFTERSEFSEKESVWIPDNTNVWYSFYFYFPKDFAILNNRLVFAQWKQSTPKPESPFLSLRFINGELISQVVYGEKRFTYEKSNGWKDEWHRALVNYQLNSGYNKDSFAKVWVDNQTFIDYKGKMGSFTPIHNTQHFKMGLYRDQVDIPQTIYFAKFRRGFTKKFCT